MKVKNITNARGRKVPDQFIVTDTHGLYGLQVEFFQSYQTIIAKKMYCKDGVYVQLDRYKWDFNKTTGKYRNIFLGETKAETQAKINSGEYILADLNN